MKAACNASDKSTLRLNIHVVHYQHPQGLERYGTSEHHCEDVVAQTNCQDKKNTAMPNNSL